MKCQKCGFENNDIVRFCIECGSPIEMAEEASSSDFYALEQDYKSVEAYNQKNTELPSSRDSYALNQDRMGMEGYRKNTPGASYTPMTFYGSLPSGNDPKLLHIAKEGWNWGAFFFNWIWLLCHNMVPWGIGLLFLSYVTGLGFIVSIYLGLKGNELAWTYRPFKNLQHFEETEKSWNQWGRILFILSLGFVVVWIAIIFGSIGGR